MSPRFGGGGRTGQGGSDEREARERSADERERARREREARRAAREGAPGAAPPPDAVVAASAPPDAVRASGPEVAPAREPEVAPVPEPPTAFEPAPAPEPDVARAPEPAPAAAPRPDDPPAAPEPSVVVQGRGDAPAGVKRVPASAMASAAGAPGPPRFGAPPRGTPRRRRGARRALPFVALLLIALVALFLYRLFEPGHGEGGERVAVTIPRGSSAEQIGDLLAARDVVGSGFFFSLRARLSGENLRSGTVALRRDMSYSAALDELTKAPAAVPKLARVTLPEGPSRRELAPRVAAAGLTGSYVKASASSTALDPADYGAPRRASLEGFLFPATYDVKPGSTARALVTQQVRTFRSRLRGVDMAYARRRGLSRFDVLTIASMVEREAGVAKDRRLIAGVIYNRLRERMPLGIDATIRYELGNFSRPLKVSELRRDTPYNTRTRVGLPPGPIGNPGLASIRAAARPARNDFVYYVVKPCGRGAHAFSSTDARFQRDVAAYNAKRDALGGKDPSRC